MAIERQSMIHAAEAWHGPERNVSVRKAASRFPGFGTHARAG
jgi:hypothetical protein